MRAQDNQRAETRSRDGRAKRQIVVLSVLLHILVLFFWDAAVRLDLSRLLPPASPPPAPAAPMVFDLQQPDSPREVIATPDDARAAQAPPKAEFLSDKNALARNQEPAPGLPVTGDPFSRGDLASHELPTPPPSPQKQAAAEPARPETAAARDQEAAEAPRDPDAEAHTDGERAPAGEKTPAAPPRPPFRFDLPRVPHRQLEGRAAESGGLSFNTYDWDFAPYMLALKQRIGHNIFPPLAFSMLGMIDGDTMLRFKIYPDGRLADLELLAFNGHRTLMETSRSAVSISAPFPTLPSDFPKPYLEVTARFTYFVKR